MADETNEAPRAMDDSRICGVSVRAYLVLMLVATVCAGYIANMILSYLASGDIVLEVKEPLYSMAVAAIAYYFGQSQKKQTP